MEPAPPAGQGTSGGFRDLWQALAARPAPLWRSRLDGPRRWLGAAWRRARRPAADGGAIERLGYLPLTARRGLWVVRIGGQVWAIAVHEHGMVPFGPIAWGEDGDP